MYLTKEQLGVKEYVVTGRKLVANVIYEAVVAMSLPRLPRDAETIIQKVIEVYRREFSCPCGNEFHIRSFATYKELQDWIASYIMTIPEVQNMNLSQNEVDNGITVDDPNRGGYVITSRYSKDPDPKDDFIDLGAYANNLAHSLMRENIEIDYSSFSERKNNSKGKK
jgi:hypothetical protein